MAINEKHEGQNQGSIEPANSKLILKDLCLRILSFVVSLMAMVFILTSKQTKLVKIPQLSYPIPITAKYTYFPALIYLVVALSLALSYTLITALASLCVLKKLSSSITLLKFYLVLISSDVVMVGVMAAATGTSGSIGYTGLKGNSKVGWNKLSCNSHRKFCKTIVVSIGMSLVISIFLAVLVVLSAYSVNRMARKALN